MFTGIIETMGEVVAVEPHGERTRLRIRTGALSEGVKLGDSIAVDGACLTVCEIDGEALSFDAVRETLEKTALGGLVPGTRVNLERAMRADGRFDGHIVQGHVDGVGRVGQLVLIGTRRGPSFIESLCIYTRICDLVCELRLYAFLNFSARFCPREPPERAAGASGGKIQLV